MNIVDEKRHVRALVIQRRDAIPADEHLMRSELGCALAFAQLKRACSERARERKPAQKPPLTQEQALGQEQEQTLERTPVHPTIALFSPLGSEIDTRPLIAQCERNEWRVCLPVMIRQPEETAPAHAANQTKPRACMKFVTLPRRYDECGELPFITQPARPLEQSQVEALGCTFVEPTCFDAAIIPLVAFDDAGFRLGYGGGNYDRLLASVREGAFVAGLAFAEQRVEHVPLEEHDRALPHLVIA